MLEAAIDSLARGTLSRSDLECLFDELNMALVRLKFEGQPEEVLWDAFEQTIQVPSAKIDRRDWIWWWEMLYATMERHGLTELSRNQVQKEFS